MKKRTYKSIQKKANEAGLSLRKGYQKYLDKIFGNYVTDENGEKIVGYEVYDYQTNYCIRPSYNDLYDHALTLKEAVNLVKEICLERGVTF